MLTLLLENPTNKSSEVGGSVIFRARPPRVLTFHTSKKASPMFLLGDPFQWIVFECTTCPIRFTNLFRGKK